MSVCVAAAYTGWNTNVFGVDAPRNPTVQFVDECYPYCLTQTQHDKENQICEANLQNCRPQALIEEEQKLAGKWVSKEYPEKSVNEEPVIMDLLNRCADRFVSTLFNSAIDDDLDDNVYEVEFDPNDSDDEASVISDDSDDMVSFQVDDLRLRARRMFLEASRNGRLNQLFCEPPRYGEADHAMVSVAFSSADEEEDDEEEMYSIMSEDDDLYEERVLAEQSMKLIRSAVEAGLAEEFPEEYAEVHGKKGIIAEDFASASTEFLEPTEVEVVDEDEGVVEMANNDWEIPELVMNVSIDEGKSTYELSKAKNLVKTTLIKALDGRLAAALSHIRTPSGEEDEEAKDVRERARESLESALLSWEPSIPGERVREISQEAPSEEISISPSQEVFEKVVEVEPTMTVMAHQPVSAEKEATLINSSKIQVPSLADVSHDKIRPTPASLTINTSAPMSTRSMQSCKSKRRIIGGVVRSPAGQEKTMQECTAKRIQFEESLKSSKKTSHDRRVSMQKISPITYSMDLNDDKINLDKDTVGNPKPRASSITKGYDALGVEFHRLDSKDDDAWLCSSSGKKMSSAIQFSSSIRSTTSLSGAHSSRVPLRSASAMSLDLGVNVSSKSARRSGRNTPASPPPRPAGAPPDLLRPAPPVAKVTKTEAKMTKPGLLPSLSGPILDVSQCSAGSVAWSVHMAKAARMRITASTGKL